MQSLKEIISLCILKTNNNKDPHQITKYLVIG